MGFPGMLAPQMQSAQVQEGRGPPRAVSQEVARVLMGISMAAIRCGCAPALCC